MVLKRARIHNQIAYIEDRLVTTNYSYTHQPFIVFGIRCLSQIR